MSKKIGVLIVEDVEDMRNTFKDALSTLGCSFFEAEEGGKALTLLKEETLDVILLDIGLPGMNGLEVLRKAMSAGVNLPPVIVITGEPSRYEKEASELGVCDYFEKDNLLAKKLREAVLRAANL
ncbi:MAG: hypothetical protein AUG51_09210 [Acidobacteria bacterium 13_1_20CM_3_53_8]|nr:MAG: hypothetical protein AUG51_09210 [Acidobacteria bacterium 13_1_20CM_3_53_8]